jgi:hypothetical protein
MKGASGHARCAFCDEAMILALAGSSSARPVSTKLVRLYSSEKVPRHPDL